MCGRVRRFYTPSAPLGLLEAGAQCAPYKLYFSNRFLAPAVREVYRISVASHFEKSLFPFSDGRLPEIRCVSPEMLGEGYGRLWESI